MGYVGLLIVLFERNSCCTGDMAAPAIDRKRYLVQVATS